MSTRQINVTLGTAGHIDHGKTALVRLLTGCETDRLKEEKERGMSIELGFAPCTLGELEVGIVDVPGHEHFIKTMVAGATGIDGVLLVVAADDGVMPQTREHLDILTLLGVARGLVALTKIDRASDERQAEVRAQIEELVRGTFLDGAPVLGVSNVTGDGFFPLQEAIGKLVASITPRSAAGVFRMPLERAFSIKGHGTVVSGVPVTGAARAGDEIVLLPQNETGRIHSIQVYGRDADTAQSGQCAAINVRHWAWSDIPRGSVVAAPGYFAPQMWYLCRLKLLAREGRFLKNASEVKFHTGTSEVTATVYLLEPLPLVGGHPCVAPSSVSEKAAEPASPPSDKRNTGGHMGPPLQEGRDDVAKAGEEWLVQVRADAPVIAGPNDGFILRLASPPETIGGGRVVEALSGKIKRTRAEAVAEAMRLADAVRSEKTFVEFAVERAARHAADAREVFTRAKMKPERAGALLAELSGEGKIFEISRGVWMHKGTLARLSSQALDALAEFHRTSSESPGLARADLATALRLDKDVAAAVVSPLLAEGKLVDRNGRLALATHQSEFSDADRKLMDAIERLFRERPFNPPGADEVAQACAACVAHPPSGEAVSSGVAQPPPAGDVSSYVAQPPPAASFPSAQARAPVLHKQQSHPLSEDLGIMGAGVPHQPHKQQSHPGAGVPHQPHQQHKQIERALKLLVEHGALVRVPPDLFFHRDAIARARDLIVEHIRAKGSLQSVDFKYLLGTSRKFAIPLLDYFDLVGLTVNRNHTRYLRNP